MARAHSRLTSLAVVGMVIVWPGVVHVETKQNDFRCSTMHSEIYCTGAATRSGDFPRQFCPRGPAVMQDGVDFVRGIIDTGRPLPRHFLSPSVAAKPAHIPLKPSTICEKQNITPGDNIQPGIIDADAMVATQPGAIKPLE